MTRLAKLGLVVTIVATLASNKATASVGAACNYGCILLRLQMCNARYPACAQGEESGQACGGYALCQDMAFEACCLRVY